MPNKYILKFQALIFLSAFLFSSCAKTERDNDILIIGTGGSLFLGRNNPVYIQRNSNSWEAFSRLDDSLNPKPGIAESWHSENNGKIWHLKLKENIIFHNGDTLNSDLAVSNILRLKNHPELDLYSIYESLDTVYTIDRLNLKLIFKNSLIDYPSKIGHYFAGIFSPKSFDKNGKVIFPYGCGPYQLKEIKSGQYESFMAFDKYYKGKPPFKGIEFRIISDPTMRMMALIRGDIDLIAHRTGLSPQDIKYLQLHSHIKVDSFKVGATHYLLFNNIGSYFSNIKNRNTLNNLIDREKLVNYTLENKGYIAEDFFINSNAVWSKKRFSKKSITGDNKFPLINNGYRPILLLNQGDLQSWGYKQIAEYIVELLNEKGIKIEIQSLESETYKKIILAGKYDMTLYPLSIPTGSPELFIRALLFSKGMPGRNSYNMTHYNSPELDSLFIKCLNSVNINEQQTLYNDILEIVFYEKIILPLFHEKFYIAFNKRLRNIKIDPLLQPDLFTIERAY